jgi:hypothetical protein
MFAYTDDQLSQIRALVTNGNFPAAYRLAASFASGGEGVSQASRDNTLITIDADNSVLLKTWRFPICIRQTSISCEHRSNPGPQ